MRPLRILLPLLILLHGCGMVPRPFQHDEKADVYPLTILPFDVRVEPIMGLPPQAAAGLARSLAQSLGGYGFTATSRSGAAAHFIIVGVYVATTREIPETDRASVQWTLFDTERAAVGQHPQTLDLAPSMGQWQESGLWYAVADEAAEPLAALLEKEADVETVVDNVGHGVFVRGVSGAPGEGDRELANAMRNALRSDGQELEEEASQASFFVQGEVTIDPPLNGAQRVELRWVVTDKEGKRLGEAAQENTVPAGSLDGYWGPVATYAAIAAAEGIDGIVQKAKSRQR